MTLALETHQLTRTFKEVKALDGVNLRIHQDTITGLLGRNGAGKTTLMSIATAQDRQSSGTVHVFGEEPFENASVIEKICFIRDNQRYPDDYRLAHALRAARIFYPNWSQELAVDLIEKFRIPEKPAVKKLSRGQLSALGIVLGLASRAPLTFFDEPYLGLDPTARTIFYDALLHDYQEHPRTIVISTHLIDEMDRLLERVIILDQGRVVREASVEDLRGSVCAISGRAGILDAFLSGRSIISRRTIGSLGTATIENHLTESDREAARSHGLTVEAVSLQDLVAAYGLSGAGSSSNSVIEQPQGSTQ